MSVPDLTARIAVVERDAARPAHLDAMPTPIRAS
jgi:hypothetical protein